MKSIKKIILSALVFVVVAALGAVYVFFTAKNREAEVKIGENVFKVEIAETSSQQAKGLSYRDGLGKDRGMFFEFNKESEYGFWMMGMRFPIDILWVKNNKIVGIEKNASVPAFGTPENALKLYYPPEPVDRVLEINAGLCDDLRIGVGDGVEYIGF